VGGSHACVEPGRSPDYSPGPGVIRAPSPSLRRPRHWGV
jgi:hypothetical protein